MLRTAPQLTTEDAPTVSHGFASELLDARIAQLTKWLADAAPECAEQQRHLDEGTTERAYWHYGYLMALRDVRRMTFGDDRPVN